MLPLSLNHKIAGCSKKRFENSSITAFEIIELCPGASLRVSKWLRAMIEHEVHHRGQIYLYLSMLDIPTPPLYGLTEEEVKRRSNHS